MSVELFDNGFFILVFLFFPISYWAGLRIADITSIDYARLTIDLISLDVGKSDEEIERPSLFTTTLVELFFSLVSGPLVILIALIHGSIVATIIFLLVSFIPMASWLHELIETNFLLALSTSAISIVIAYIGRVAKKVRGAGNK